MLTSKSFPLRNVTIACGTVFWQSPLVAVTDSIAGKSVAETELLLNGGT